jgi:hypothetical protein
MGKLQLAALLAACLAISLIVNNFISKGYSLAISLTFTKSKPHSRLEDFLSNLGADFFLKKS